MKSTKNIVFDVGMVLIDFCWEKACRRLGLSEEVISAFAEHMVYSQYWNRLDEGTISQKEAIEKFREAMPEYAAEVELFWSEPEWFVEEYQFSAPLIRSIKEQGYSVYLLSNYPYDMFRLHWPAFEFFHLVDGYVVSSVERLVKPDPAIYELLCERYGLIPEECLFVDDRPGNVEAARKIGMEGIVFENEGQLRRELSALPIIG